MTSEASDPVRSCSQCGKKLRSNNTRGICSGCTKGGAAAEASGGEGRKSAARDKTVLKRFRVVAAALGVDPEGLLEGFARSWLKRLQDRVEAHSDDDFVLPSERAAREADDE